MHKFGRTHTIECVQGEQLVMAAVGVFQEAASAIRIYTMVCKVADKHVDFDSMYETLERLNKKGYLSAKAVERRAKYRGKPARLYCMSALGAQALQESVLKAADIIDDLRALPARQLVIRQG